MKEQYSTSRYVTDISTPNPPAWKSIGLWTCLIIGVLCSFTTVILLAYIGAQFANIESRIAALCFVSIVLNLLSIGFFGIVSWRHRSNPQTRQDALVYSSLASLFISIVLTLAAAIWIQVWSGQMQEQVVNIVGLDIGLIVASIMSALTQAFLLGSIIFTSRQSTQTKLLQNDSLREITIISRPVTSKTETTIQSNPFSVRSGTTSPPLSISAISVQSIPSRTNSKATRSRPSSNVSEVSQFDFHWDTSNVPATLRDTVHRSVSSKLPPIPGSRPVSPAKALDGPFLPPSPHPNQSQPTSPTDASHFPLLPPEQNDLDSELFLPPQLPYAETSASSQRSYSPGRTNQPQVSRRPSMSSLVESVSHLATTPTLESGEANIHPLFRSNSPNPAPQASKGTVVRAASVLDAEGVVSGSRSRAPSRSGPSKPSSPLIHETEWQPIKLNTTDSLCLPSPEEGEDRSASFTSDIIVLPSLPRSSTTSRPRESIDSFATQTTPSSNTSKAPSISDTVVTRASSRRERPAKDTPIPGFILAAGNRNSLLDFEARLEARDDTVPREEVQKE